MEITRCINCFSQLNDDSLCPICGYDNAVYTPEPHHLPPETVLHGRYVVGKALGEGGFGITYAGFDTVLRRKVAIKEYFPGGSVWRDPEKSLDVSCYTSKNLRETFEIGRQKCISEAQSLARLDDIPSIVRILDFFSENNTAYIIMEFVEGTTLKDYVKRLPGRMTMPEILALLQPVTDALQTVHKRGFVHRDISPDNIMITQDGTAKLLDFGAVKSVSAGGEATQNPVVKRGFSPLELYSTEGLIGTWTDVYALCATIYYLLTGEAPDEPMDRLVEDHVAEKLGSLLSAEQKGMLLHGLTIQPRERCQTIKELYSLMENKGTLLKDEESASENLSKTEYTAAENGQDQNNNMRIKRIAGIAIAVLAIIMAVVLATSVSNHLGRSRNEQSSSSSESSTTETTTTSYFNLEPAEEAAEVLAETPQMITNATTTTKAAPSTTKAPVPETLSRKEILNLYANAEEVYEDWLLDAKYADCDHPVEIHGEWYGLVKHNKINSVASLKKYLHTVFLPELYEEIVDENYIDYNGNLYFVVPGLGDGGGLYISKCDINQSGNRIVMKITYKDFSDGGTLVDEITIVYENGNWLFTKDFDCALDLNNPIIKGEDVTAEVVNDDLVYMFNDVKIGQIVNTEGYGLVFRSSPERKTDNKIGLIDEDTRIQVLGYCDYDHDWVYVSFNGKKGFACAKYEGTTYIKYS